MEKAKKTIKYLIPFIALVTLIVAIVLVFHAQGAPVVKAQLNGPRAIVSVEGVDSPTYQWQIAEERDGTYSNIDGANQRYYDISSIDEAGCYLRVNVSGTYSEPVGPVGKLVELDVANGNISFNGSTYSAYSSSKVKFTGNHYAENLYVIKQSNSAEATTNKISVDANGTYDITIDSLHICNYNDAVTNTPGNGGLGSTSKAMIDINCGSSNRNVTLRIKGENQIRYIRYSSTSNNSSLKITDINGDGVSDGGSLYLPYKIKINNPASLTIDENGNIANEEQLNAFMADTAKTLNHWNSAIGGDDSSADRVQNFTIAGGYVQALTNYQDNCTAIGAGGNGYSNIKITGGTVVAMCKGTGAAIGGGIGWNSQGGNADVEITGGKVYAYNLGRNKHKEGGVEYTVGGVAIGAGSSFYSNGNTSPAKITISGGEVVAFGAFGNGIGGGNSSTKTGGVATINISGGKVIATSIGGGSSQSGTGGDATVNVSLMADVTLTGGIGGGSSQKGAGGAATVTVTGGTMNCGGVIGGGNGGGSDTANPGNGGEATITVTDGTLTAKSIGGGVGSESGNGGNAKIDIDGGVIVTGSIGGGSTTNTNGGKIGYAIADISGGDITGQFVMAAGGAQPCSFTMTDGILHGVDVTDPNSQYSYVQTNGAAVYMDDPEGVATLTGGSIENCNGVNGGAVYMTAGKFTLGGAGLIKNCTATGYGGAVYLGGGEVIINGGEILSNTANIDGGAIYLTSGTVTVNGGSISSNTAERDGGAVYLANGTVTLNDGEISSNSSECDGGGLYLANGTLTVFDGKISANEAGRNGGGAYVNGGDVLLKGGSVLSNVATNNGGGIAVFNGNYVMTGGEVNNNTATTNNGGGIYVSSEGDSSDAVSAIVTTGSISSNKAGKSGGALSVETSQSSTVEIEVTIGVNEKHTVEDGVIYCNHDENEGDADDTNGCPKIENNTANGEGGAIFIVGSTSTNLNLYCLIENGSVANDSENSLSDFMKVEGGTVCISSSEVMDEDRLEESTDVHGYMTVKNTVYITGGVVTMWGSTSSPKFDANITVDITKDGDEFNDYRLTDGHMYTIIYYENFRNPGGTVTGQYTVTPVAHDTRYAISGVIYNHPGYTILGWYLNPDGTGYKYEVSKEYHFLGSETDPETPGNLIIYAQWQSNYYEVEFLPGVPNDVVYQGTMDNQLFVFDQPEKLNKNQYVYAGHMFTGWYDAKNDTTWADGQQVNNLSYTDGSIVTLVAQWTDCNHDVSLLDFTYSVDGNVIKRECSCKQYYQTATITASGGVYSKDAKHEATYEVEYQCFNGVTPATNEWSFEISYAGTENSGTVLSGAIAPENAGSYEASITHTQSSVDGEGNPVSTDYTATVSFTVERAEQVAPGEPSYTKEGSDDVYQSILVVPNVNDPTGKKYEYRVAYLVDGEPVYVPWQENATIQLPVALTTYTVYIRYVQEDNYNASEAVAARNTFYYATHVIIYIDSLGFIPNFQHSDDGLDLLVAPAEGYYKSKDYKVVAETKVGDQLAEESKRAIVSADYTKMTNIPAGTDGNTYEIYVTITGAKETVIISDAVESGEQFGIVEDEQAIICVDSAFTAYFKLENFDSAVYPNLAFAFSSALPKGTTLILVDKLEESYWHYEIGTATDKVTLESFTKMGASGSYIVNSTTLELQLIVDFSDVDNGNLLSPALLSVDVNMVTSGKTDNGAPDLDASVNVELSDVAQFSATNNTSIVNNSGLVRYVDVTYAYVEGEAVASKWNGRGGALVLTSIGSESLPIDAQLKANDGEFVATYLQNSLGQFIVPISIVGKGVVELKLQSDLFPAGQVQYQFKVELYASYSKASSSPVNGELKATIDALVFEKDVSATPALKVYEVTQNNGIYKKTDRLIVDIQYTGMPAQHSITATLMLKNTATGEYSSTGWSKPIDSAGKFEVGISGENGGSYCLQISVKIETGETIMIVPFYFVIIN